MPQKIIDFVNLGVAGLLGLLWWDIRNIRKDKEKSGLDLEKRFNTNRDELFDIFMKRTDHEVLCENAGLKLQQHVSKEIAASEKRILTAIKKSNGHGKEGS